MLIGFFYELLGLFVNLITDILYLLLNEIFKYFVNTFFNSTFIR